ncbi:MAG TPA: hypothetical protein VEB64_02330 [Azospirillaceae bacterium]|nr:hypothetical protein [Azospirillaceae bacterium]
MFLITRLRYLLDLLARDPGGDSRLDAGQSIRRTIGRVGQLWSRYMTLESIAPLDDDEPLGLPAATD